MQEITMSNSFCYNWEAFWEAYGKDKEVGWEMHLNGLCKMIPIHGPCAFFQLILDYILHKTTSINLLTLTLGKQRVCQFWECSSGLERNWCREFMWS